MTEMTVRRAVPGDEAVMTQLRAVMFAAMGQDTGPADAPWRRLAEEWFATWLTRPEAFAAFVAEDPDLGVVSMAAGLMRDRPPAPRHPSGLTGRIINVCTDDRRRHRGLARACMVALISWFEQGGAHSIELGATSEGDGLYRSLGFAVPDFPRLFLDLGQHPGRI